MTSMIVKFWRRLTPGNLVAFLNTLILVVAQWLYGGLGGYDRLAASLGSCLAAEYGLSLWLLGRRPRSLLSPYISGISLALLLKPAHGLLWPFVVGGFLAIGSKYVLRYRGRHLWNPTNFAITVLLLVAAPVLTKLTHEWGNSLAANLIIWAVGLVVVGRAGLLHVTLSYAAAFLALAALRGQSSTLWAEIGPITGPMYQLFVFFMITDPPTLLSTRRKRIVVAVSIAVVEALIRTGLDLDLAFLAPLAPAPALFALAIVGPAAKAIELRLTAAPSTAGTPQPAAR
jgi:Na+-translocating ferredoxin:NAD+ oxidoreductase RnfD subunit